MSKGSVLFSRKDAKTESEEIWDDSALIRMYEKSIEKTYDKIRTSGSTSSLNASTAETSSKRRESIDSNTGDQWKPNDLCMAPYEGKWYPATIISIDEKKKTCKVLYNGYDQEEIVDLKDLLRHVTNPRKRNTRTVEENLQTSSSTSSNTQKRIRIDETILQRTQQSQRMNDGQSYSSWKISTPSTSLNESTANKSWEHHKIKNIASNMKKPVRNLAEASKLPIFPHSPKRPALSKQPIDTREDQPSEPIPTYNPSTYKHLKNKITQKVSGHDFSPAKFYIEEVQSRLNTKLSGFLREEDVEWSQDEPESALEDSAMDESQSSLTEDILVNEKAKKKSRKSSHASLNASAGISIKQIMDPDLIPPPPPALFGKAVVANNEKEALTNMLMSWYMTGYHTGYFQAMRDMKEKPSGSGQGKKL